MSTKLINDQIPFLCFFHLLCVTNVEVEIIVSLKDEVKVVEKIVGISVLLVRGNGASIVVSIFEMMIVFINNFTTSNGKA